MITDARDSPKRIQLSRKKGWRKPPGAIVVSRPSRWGNPFRAVQVDGRWRVQGAGLVVTGYPTKEYAVEDAVRLYKLHVGPLGLIERNVEEFEALRGHDLVCWCRLDQACHADVLLEYANK